jgi:hypothetical protein
MLATIEEAVEAVGPTVGGEVDGAAAPEALAAAVRANEHAEQTDRGEEQPQEEALTAQGKPEHPTREGQEQADEEELGGRTRAKVGEARGGARRTRRAGLIGQAIDLAAREGVFDLPAEVVGESGGAGHVNL